MAIKIRSVITAHRAKANPEMGGAIDILGAFDELIQPLFPLPMQNMAMVISFEGMERNTMFEMRLNGPNDELISKGEFGVAVSPFGNGKKIIDMEKFLIKERGKYSLDILEKGPQGLKFVQSYELFTAAYPPKRIFKEGEVEAILGNDEVIRTIKTEFRPFGAKEAVRLQMNLDTNKGAEEGHTLFPSSNEIEIEGTKHDLTGLRRQMEWMFGRPIPKQEEAKKNEEKSEETK